VLWRVATGAPYVSSILYYADLVHAELIEVKLSLGGRIWS